ncbi:hypothetical protein ACFFMP_20135 [Pseudoroseomonas cervicalis]|uniref:Uncharacterized protein n=1 Tax=Pseudoroseomonas cervicalis ATCC 49957 TaxID=525371 RepID=D5RQ71_9PROT|nr:hypothetical protein [Pseudoroseomonas cervicalis]EFH10529.1 hypothetical protein HMPREF0731_3233 [Pseudoroseomonas cervicalis ATCC 49957]
MNNTIIPKPGNNFEAQARDLAGATVAAFWLGAAPQCSFDYDHESASWLGRLHWPALPNPAHRLLGAAAVLAGFMARPALPQDRFLLRKCDVRALANARADVLAATEAAGGDATAGATIHERLLIEVTVLVSQENDRIAAVAARLFREGNLTARDLRPLMRGLGRTTPSMLFDHLRCGLSLAPLPPAFSEE